MSQLPAETKEMQGHSLSFWAEQYDLCERTLRRAIAEGRLRCLRFGRAIRVTPKQMSEYVSSLEG
jgi:hypothetical protein